MFTSTRLSLVFAALVIASSASATSVFNFDTDSLGKGTVFTDTNNGISATFSSSNDPNGFTVENPAAFGVSFNSLTGNVLIDNLINTKSQLTLTIVFSSLISNVTMNFAVVNNAPTPFILQAFNNNTSVGTATATDSPPPGFFFAEGVASFNAANFNEIVLSSPANAFAVDNITVTAAIVPEPGTIPLFSGFLVLSALAVRRIRGRLS